MSFMIQKLHAMLSQITSGRGSICGTDFVTYYVAHEDYGCS